MRIKVILDNNNNNNNQIPVNNNNILVGFVNNILGNNNEYHGKTGQYCLSSLQGGKLNTDKKTLSFSDNNPYFYFSSMNLDTITKFISNINNLSNNIKCMGMSISNIDVIDDFKVNNFFDNVITISPILLYNNDYSKKITFKTSNNWVNLLIEQSKRKLKHYNIYDETFNIEIVKPHKSKHKTIFYNDIFNPCTLTRLKIYGKKETRYTLYNLGLGASNAIGFGAINIMN